MSDGLFRCPNCGNSLNWLERLAGQRLRCKCGVTLTVPPEPGMQATAITAPISTKTPAKAAAIGYRAAADEDGEPSPYKHLLWPIIIASAGLVLTIIYYAAALPLSFPAAMAVMVVRTTIDLVLLFAGCMIAMRLLDMALGEPVEAIIKLVGVALLPSAIEGLIGSMLPGGYLLGWSIALGLYGALLMWFFTLNGKEVMTLTAIIYVIQSWAGLLIAAVLMQNVLGSKLPLNGPLGWMLGQGSAAQTPSDKADAAAQEALNRPDAMEGVTWLMTGQLRSISGRSNGQSQHLVGAFYNAHAPSVQLADVTRFPDRREIAAEMVVQLPPDLPDRQRAIALAQDAGMTTPVDPKQSYLLIKFPHPTE